MSHPDSDDQSTDPVRPEPETETRGPEPIGQNAGQEGSPLLAEQMGDPSGPPQPEEAPQAGMVGNALAGTLLVGTAVCIAGLVLPVLMTPSLGSTRSARVQWESRQQEIEQALIAARADGATPQRQDRSTP